MDITVRLPDDLVAALARAIAQELRETETPAQSPEVAYVSRSQAVAMGVERRALLRAERSCELPAFKPGKTVLYRRGDVLALIERARVLPEPAVADVVELPSDPFERARSRARARLHAR